MKFIYKQVDTSTLKGLKQAERLHANGWKTVRVGLFINLMEKEVSVSAREYFYKNRKEGLGK